MCGFGPIFREGFAAKFDFFRNKNIYTSNLSL